MGTLKEITYSIQVLLLASGFKKEWLDDGDTFDSSETDYVDAFYKQLMNLRNSDYKTYLDLLSVLILRSDYYWEAIATIEEIEKENREDEEYLLVDLKHMVDLLEEAGSLLEFDRKLADRGELELLEDVIYAYAQGLAEMPGGMSYVDIYYDIETSGFYKNFVRQELLLEGFNEAITYAMKEGSLALADMLGLAYQNFESADNSYQLHQYIIQNHREPEHIEGIVSYIHELLWMTYIGCVRLQRNKLGSQESESFLFAYEHKEGFILEKCKELIDPKTIPDVFYLFLATHQPSIYHDEEVARIVRIEMEREKQQKTKVNGYIKMLYKENK